MEKKIGILVVLLAGIVMVAYSYFTINEENDLASQELENEVLIALAEIDTNVSNYLDTYVDIVEELSLNKEMLYDEQVSYKGFAHMDAIQVKHPEILNIYYGSETGKMLLWPDSDLPEGYDPRERPWYIGALNSEEIVWSPPYMDVFAGHLILSCAQELVDNQQLNGVLGLDLKLNQDIFLPTDDLSIAYEVIVLSEWGTIIHHTDADLIGQNNLDGELSQGIEEGLTFFEYVPYRTMLDLDQSVIGANSTLPVESKNEKTAFVKTNKLGWSIILTLNTDDLK